MPLMETVMLPVADIYVPVKLRKTLNPKRLELLAESLLDDKQPPPIQVRHDGERWVLVKGLHRLEALRALGEESVAALVVRARRH